MLHTINLITEHKTFRLNRHIYYFLLKIKNIPATASFDPYDEYFPIDFLKKVKGSNVLRDKLKKFFNAFKRLKPGERNTVIDKFKASQNIENILSNMSFDGNAIKLSALPIKIQKVTYELFKYLFSATLLSYGKKDHYEKLFNLIPSSICPFCGLEKLATPDFNCPDYDHMLYKGAYPFATVNMRNLIPMGTDCNRNHKKTADILYDEYGSRRKFLYPYTSFLNVAVSLDGSILPNGGGDKGNWELKFKPDNDYTRTWDSIFRIKERYQKSELEKYYDQWLGVFKSYCKRKPITWSETLLREELKDTGQSYIENPLDTSNIIKGALFLFLANCKDQAFFNALIAELNS